MTNQWFRSWHGAPTDPKWLGIARKAGVAPGIVAAVVWALLDRASQAKERGTIDGYDADGIACFMGCEPEQVETIIGLMHEKCILIDNAFSGWDKHQPKREDGAAERAKEWRERKRTQANAAEQKQTLDTDTDTDTEKEAVKPREGLADLEVKLREAAGWQNEPAPGLFVTGPIQELLDNGASLELDVLPVIRGRAKSAKARSWRYFVGAIQDALKARREAGTGPPQRVGSAVPEKSFEELAKELLPGWTPGTKFASNTG